MFKLLRYFSLTSLIIFISIIILLSFFYRQIIIRDITTLAESKNAALTQAFANSLSSELIPFLNSASSLSEEELRNHSEIPRLNEAVLTQMQGTGIIRIKVYDLNGLTVFSTNSEQIGEDESQDAGFQAALVGQIGSKLIHRDTANLEGVIEERDIIESYIPVRGPAQSDLSGSQPIIAVFEVYDDVSPALKVMARSQQNITIGLTAILLLAYGGLYIIVRRADNIIRRQYQDLQQNEKDLAQARDEALAASNFKSQMLHTVSHDMRTPLNAILGYAEMLQEGVYGAMADTQDQAVAEIIDSTQDLLNFVTELLDQAQIEAGKLTLKMADVAPTEVMAQMEKVARVLVEAKGVQLNCAIAPEMPTLLRGDPQRLGQILNNLVGNAVKFTEQGSIDARFYLTDSNHWAIEVTDTGPGIPPVEQMHMFEPFRRGNASSEANSRGLGLAIVSQLTKLMGGEIQFKSEVGRGSCFTVRLPLEPTWEQTT